MWAVALAGAQAFSSGLADPLSVEEDAVFARGINLPSAAFNDEHTPGVYGKDYIYPGAATLEYYRRKEFTVVRLPFRWERLQPALFGELDQAELERIKAFVASARGQSMRVILSPHNFGRYRLNGEETLIGTAGVPLEAFTEFMRKLATAFVGNDAVYAISLMNEPHDTRGMWKATAQAGLDAIRKADRRRLVLAPGDQWSEASKWRTYNNDFILRDQASMLIYEAHQYFDSDHTGTYKQSYALSGASSERGVEWVRPFVDWLSENRQKGIITEFGVPNEDPGWLKLAERLLEYLAQERIPWTYWAGGPWWHHYRLSAEPQNGIDAPVMTILTKNYGMNRP